MRYRSTLMLLILLAGLVSTSGSAIAAFDFPTDDNTFVIDDANALTDNEAANLEQLSQGLEDAWGTEIVIVVIESVSAHATGADENATLPYFTVKLFDRWDVGDPLWKDGILLVLAINQTGSWEWWYEAGLFWDDTGAFRNIGAAADPHFDSGNWSDGLEIVAGDLSYDAESYWIENDGFVSPPGSAGGQEGAGSIVAAIFCLAIAVLGIIAVAVLLRGGTVTSGPGAYYDGPGVYQPWYRRRYWGRPGMDLHHEQHHHDTQHNRLESGSFQSRRTLRSSSGGARRSSSRGSSRGGGSRGSSRSSGSGGRRGGGRRGSR